MNNNKQAYKSLYLIREVVLFESELLPLAAFGVVRGRVFPVLLQLQAHLLQLALMTQQLLFLNQAQTREKKRKPPNTANQMQADTNRICKTPKPCIEIFYVEGLCMVLL